MKEAFNITPINWSYDNKDKWVCPNHQSQSPININISETVPMSDQGSIALSYHKTIDAVIDTGVSIQGFAKGTAEINQRLFSLSQFHFHAHSEHTIENKHYPLELHFVHESQNGTLAVLAVLFHIEKTNPALTPLLLSIGKTKGPIPVNLYKLLPSSFDYYHYLGSLTTPPLTENVEWYIFKESVGISQNQLDHILNYHNHNYRPTQPLNGRQVLEKTFNRPSHS